MDSTFKLVNFDAQARAQLAEGVDILADAVRVTMGPAGRNVVIERPGEMPILTKDGVTVAQAINLRDKFRNLGVQMIKEAASRTADTAGDGTTTATVLAQSIFSEGMRVLAARASSVELKRGIDIASQLVIEELLSMAVPITDDDDVVNVATISANGERDIGVLIGEAISKVGREGVVTVEEAKGFKTSLTVVDGMQVDRGYLSPYFITNPERMSCELDNPFILITGKKLSSTKEIVPVLEKILEAGRSVLIIAEDVDGEAMQTLVVNKAKGSLSVCAVRAPGFGEQRIGILEDLSTLVGGTVIIDAAGLKLETTTLQQLGSCKKVVVTRNTTTLIGCGGDSSKIAERTDLLRQRLVDPYVSDEEKHSLKTRIAKLAGGVAVIHVGGATEVELRERKDRVDDALSATRAAIAEGIVTGGGLALVKASKVLRSDHPSLVSLERDVKLGVEIIRRACMSPFRQIIVNAGRSPEVILDKITESDDDLVYDVRHDCYVRASDCGVIDPVMVVRSALENASSAAGMMLTVGCTVVEDEPVSKS